MRAQEANWVIHAKASEWRATPRRPSEWANVGIADRLLRLLASAGLIVISLASDDPIAVVAVLAAIDLMVTGASGFSLLYDAFGLDTRSRAARETARPFGA